MKEDTLSYIRDNKEITFEQKIRLVIMLSLPTIMAQVSSIIMQYIDASMVGRLGAGCSASIGLVSTTTWLLGSLASAPSLGFSIQVAQLVGAKKFNRARRVFLQSFGIVLLISIIIGAANHDKLGTSSMARWRRVDTEGCGNVFSYNIIVYAGIRI